jgi:cytochrome c biogenesis protein CcdA
MDFLQQIIEQYNLPILSAFVLGLMTAISPCPLATNITATAYIARSISRKREVLLSGVLYSFGRAVSYTAIGLILYFGASKFHLQRFFSQNGEKFLGPLLIIIGLVLLNVIKINFSGGGSFESKMSERFKDRGLLGSFVLGIVFALAFCPYSGALFFGMLVPMSISSPSGLYLPVVFAIGTGLPVIVFTYFMAFAAEKVGKLYQGVRTLEQAMRWVAGVVFVLAGIYYVAIFAELI